MKKQMRALQEPTTQEGAQNTEELGGKKEMGA